MAPDARRILVVDDDADLAEVLDRVLEKSGYEVDWARNGAEALQLLQGKDQHGPDLVLHGHAHAGTFEGAIAQVPVYNVSVHVMGRDFWLFELDVSVARTPIH